MSTISDAMNNARSKIANVYSVLEDKGAEMPEVRDLDHLVTTVEGLSQFDDWSIRLGKYRGSDVDVVFPSGDNVKILAGCFYGTPMLEKIKSVDLGNTSFFNKSMKNAFSYCSNLITVTNMSPDVNDMSGAFTSCSKFNQNVQIPHMVTNMHSTFYGCRNLTEATIGDSVIEADYAFEGCTNFNSNINISDSMVNMRWTFGRCQSLNPSNPIVISDTVINMSSTFDNCTSLDQDVYIGGSLVTSSGAFQSCQNFSSNIYIESPCIANYADTFNNTSLPKNVYIPFKYINNVNTVTYNSFKSIYGSGQNGVTLISTSKVNATLSTNWGGVETESRIGLLTYKGSSASVVGPTSDLPIYYYSNAFNAKATSIVRVDLNDNPFMGQSMENSFNGCTQLTSIQNMNSSIKNMSATFYNCFNFNQDLQIPSSVTNMRNTFFHCVNYNSNIVVHSETVYDFSNCFFGATKEKNIFIPCRKRDSRVPSATFNSFYDAGYWSPFSGNTIARDISQFGKSIYYAWTDNSNETVFTISETPQIYDLFFDGSFRPVVDNIGMPELDLIVHDIVNVTSDYSSIEASTGVIYNRDSSQDVTL